MPAHSIVSRQTSSSSLYRPNLGAVIGSESCGGFGHAHRTYWRKVRGSDAGAAQKSRSSCRLVVPPHSLSPSSGMLPACGTVGILWVGACAFVLVSNHNG